LKLLSLGIAISILFFSCKEKNDENATISQLKIESVDRKIFNLEILPVIDTNCAIIKGKKKEDTVFNRLYIVDTSSFKILKDPRGKVGRNVYLWPCNFPDILNHGDTIVASADRYYSFGDEKVPGAPCLLTRIFIQAKYAY
jgi:hypothetical protein